MQNTIDLLDQYRPRRKNNKYRRVKTYESLEVPAGARSWMFHNQFEPKDEYETINEEDVENYYAYYAWKYNTEDETIE